MSSTPDIMQDCVNIDPLMQRAAETVAHTMGADHVRLMFLDDSMGKRRHVVRYGGDQVENQTASNTLDSILECIVHDELPADLEIIQPDLRYPDCTAYSPSPVLLQEHGLRTGLFVTRAHVGARLALFAGRSATGTEYGEAEALRACELLELVALAIGQIAAMLRIVEVKQQCESIMDTLPQLVALLDEQGHVIRTNLTLEQWNLGKVEAIRGANVHDMLHPSCGDWNCGLRARWDHMWQQFKEGESGDSEFHDEQLDRDLHFSLISYPESRYGQAREQQVHVSLLIEDISRRAHAERMLKYYSEELELRLQEKTLELSRVNAELKKTIQEQKRVAATLRESEQKYTCLVEATLTGIYVIQNNRLVFCNARFSELFGYSHEAICRMYLEQLFPDDQEETHTNLFADYQPSDPVFDRNIVRGLTGNGDTLWLQRTLTAVICNGEPMVLGNVIDITEQKKMEEALRSSRLGLQLLSKRLIHTQEAERKRIAAELHDSIGQSISAVKFSVENALGELEERSPDSVSTHLHNAIDKLRGTMDEVRRISMDLRPAMLDDLGLIATINWFMRDMQSLVPEVVFSKQIAVAEDEIPVDRKIVIFRILQEALNNIGKHAHASHVDVSLAKRDDGLVVLIKDDGVGFAMELLPEAHGFGLNSMRERVNLSGGSFTLDSTPGTGTVIRVLWETERNSRVTE
jgi:PAS domain S-box-containing protein